MEEEAIMKRVHTQKREPIIHQTGDQTFSYGETLKEKTGKPLTLD